ncbi:MAG: hypothetical protein JXQ90_15850 [Cyclobacteriaceae bacterium]
MKSVPKPSEPSESKPISVQEISFPKGGGSISGIGDSFETNLFNGSGSYSIPIPITKARGFEPNLSINYNSGSGNGIFGLGFSLSLSKITVNTSKGIPKYDGIDEYLLNGELLVVKQSTSEFPNPRTDTYQGKKCQVTNYIPRFEHAFSKIEHWQNIDEGLSFWKVITADNVTSYFGINAKIANPSNPSQIFKWLVDHSNDSKGNQIIYSYTAENDDNISRESFELNRSKNANRYIQKIQYGNYVDDRGKTAFAFELNFNYDQLSKKSDSGWTARSDPFSSYKSGFEIRTYRLCHSIQLTHNFPEENVDSTVVKELSFTYENQLKYEPVVIEGLSKLSKVILSGFRDGSTASYPPIQFDYSTFQAPIAPEFQLLSIGEDGNIPGHLNTKQYLPVDLYGEGLPGFLVSNETMSLYLEPLGNGQYNHPISNFEFPINKNIQRGKSSLTDLDGNGRLDLVVKSQNAPGSYTQTFERNWDEFVPFDSYPTIISDPNVEMVDLSATGRRDALLPHLHSLEYFPSEGKKGFTSARTVGYDHDFPIVKKGFSKELVTFSNMFGDGLSHRVKITNGSVECWPCLGHGQFGEKITFGNAPAFGNSFDSNRLFLADIDGSGTTDIAYLYADRVEIFINQSGNSFSDAITVSLPETFNELDQVTFADILGNGTACLVFTKIAPTPKHYYYSFSGGKQKLPDGRSVQSLKPYLLNKIDNGMGLAYYFKYCTSTKFVLEDKLAGNPWVTKLPFPVQVVEELIQYDLISKSRYVSKYKYHDGYYDPDQKQFLGFGYIESWDSETFESYQESYSNPDFPVEELNKELFVPPVYTKTWYLNGAPLSEYEKLLEKYQAEFYKADKSAYKFPRSSFSSKIISGSNQTRLQAYNSLHAKVIRKEVYALDDSVKEFTPYTVHQSNYNVNLIQPANGERYAVFLVNKSESIRYHYERNKTDPRVQQEFVLEIDKLCGKPKKSCTVYLPRRSEINTPFAEQKELKIVAQCLDYINTSDKEEYRYRGIPYQAQSFEVLSFDINGKNYCSSSEMETIKSALDDPIPYQATSEPGKVQARQLTWERSYYWDESQKKCLALGQIASRALEHHKETAVFNKDFISKAFGSLLSDDVIHDNGGYFFDKQSGYWWNKGLVQYYFDSSKPNSFYLPSILENSFVSPMSSLYAKSAVAYNQPYNFSVVKVTQYIDESNRIKNIETAEIDYFTLEPFQLIDVNGRVSQAIFDPLGRVIATSLFGTENGKPTGGMLLYPYKGKPKEYIQHNDVTFKKVLTDSEKYLQGASSFYYYDQLAWVHQKQPAFSIELKRDDYYLRLDKKTKFACKTVINYSDGFGRILEQKTKADPGLAYVRDENGKLNPGKKRKPIETFTTERYLVSGRTVYNNKGKPCEQYLQYFSNTPSFERQEEITDLKLVPPPKITHYDPLLRVIRIDTPKGFFSRIEFSPWEQKHFDENDTVIDSVYFINFMKNFPKIDKPTQAQIDEKDALDKASKFYNTPTIFILDNIGNKIRTIQNNLGSVDQGFFSGIVTGNITSRQLFEELIKKGYLIAYNNTKSKAWVTDKFQPYAKGFKLQLDNPYQQFSLKVLDLLKQNCLVAYHAYDIQGRPIIKTDPRLYYDNQSKGSEYFNFKYSYAMGQKEPTIINSVDAGLEKHLFNIFGKQLWSLSPRNYCQFISYDRLQRRVALQMKEIKQDVPIPSFADFNVAEVQVYGESKSAPTVNNLRGNVWKTYDLSGVLINSQYGLQNDVLENSRQLVKDYMSPISWNCLLPPTPKLWNSGPKPKLDSEIYANQYSFNALRLLISEKTHDGSITQNGYNQLGLLNQVGICFDESKEQKIINQIEYDAKLQRTSIQYGNDITTVYQYEPATLRLEKLISTKDLNSQGTVQNQLYAYDPVGNVTRVRNYTSEIVFPKDNKIDPLFDYSYDALYRLTKSNGNQHPDITEDTYKNNTKDGDFKQCKFNQLPSDNQTKEPDSYQEIYSYDDSGNLINKEHVSTIKWSMSTPVNPNSNHLSGLKYDASGNMSEIEINGKVGLSYDYCENLLSTESIKRQGENSECDYYIYDLNKRRTRTTTEITTSKGTQLEEKVYFGAFEQKKLYDVDGTEILHMNTVRVKDGFECRAIVHSWIKGDSPTGSNREIRFQLTNDQRSISLEYDLKANLISYEEYFPYGGTAIIAGEDENVVGLKNYRYTGKERDDSTGLYYYGDRYYSPWLGRWISADPSGPHHGLNLYTYVTNDPTSYIDPTGDTRAQLEAFYGKKAVAQMATQMDTAFRYLTTTEIATMQSIAQKMEVEVTAGLSVYSSPVYKQFVGEFDKYKILNFAHNPVLADLWTDSLGKIRNPGNYDALKLYKMARGHFTGLIKEQYGIEFNYMQLGKPPEIHHAEYKSLAPSQALNPANLWLFSRGSKNKSVFGQHELIHQMSAANHSNFYNVEPAPSRQAISAERASSSMMQIDTDLQTRFQDEIDRYTKATKKAVYFDPFR